MSTTPDALAAEYVGRHQLTPTTAADMQADLVEWMTWIGGNVETDEQRDLRLLTQVFS